MFIDSHCHLNYPEFSEDIDKVIKRANKASVTTMLSVSTELAEIKQIMNICRLYEGIYMSIGIHPHNASKDLNNFGIEELRKKFLELSNNKKVIGIGETGLDYYYKNSACEDQKRNFMFHIEIAADVKLPLIVHSRESNVDTLKLLKEKRDCVNGVFHCFSGDISFAKKCLEMGFFISFSGIVTFKKAEELKDVVKYVPLDRLLLETDAPFLAPEPYRGRRNEPSYLSSIAEVISSLKNVKLSKLAEVTSSNFFYLFNKANKIGSS